MWDQAWLPNFIRLRVRKNSLSLCWSTWVNECTILDPFCKNDFDSFWIQMFITSERIKLRSRASSLIVALLQSFWMIIKFLSFHNDEMVWHWLEDPFFFYDSGGSSHQIWYQYLNFGCGVVLSHFHATFTPSYTNQGRFWNGSPFLLWSEAKNILWCQISCFLSAVYHGDKNDQNVVLPFTPFMPLTPKLWSNDANTLQKW